jgi:hypothetical protein
MTRLMGGFLSIFLVAAAVVLPAIPASANDAATTRIETRRIYGATVTVEHGVRVYRPLPADHHVIINPGRVPLKLSFNSVTERQSFGGAPVAGNGEPVYSGYGALAYGGGGRYPGGYAQHGVRVNGGVDGRFGRGRALRGDYGSGHGSGYRSGHGSRYVLPHGAGFGRHGVARPIRYQQPVAAPQLRSAYVASPKVHLAAVSQRPSTPMIDASVMPMAHPRIVAASR